MNGPVLPIATVDSPELPSMNENTVPVFDPILHQKRMSEQGKAINSEKDDYETKKEQFTNVSDRIAALKRGKTKELNSGLSRFNSTLKNKNQGQGIA